MALVPLATIGVSLVVARGVLAWLTLAGWEVSPLVELFLVVVLFGSGTDFCLFLAWRFGEHFSAEDPAAAMEATLRSSTRALLTSAGDGDRRPLADGDDPVQALLEHRAERGAGAGADGGGVVDADAGLAGAAGAVPAAARSRG